MSNPGCKEGDRIRLDHMPNDPNPIPPGTTGTVTKVVLLGKDDYQIMVNWDIPRSLSLVPEDKFTVIESAPEVPDV